MAVILRADQRFGHSVCWISQSDLNQDVVNPIAGREIATKPGVDHRMLRRFLNHQFAAQDVMSTDLIMVKQDEQLRVAVDHM